jgi:hypothetical protein
MLQLNFIRNMQFYLIYFNQMLGLDLFGMSGKEKNKLNGLNI